MKVSPRVSSSLLTTVPFTSLSQSRLSSSDDQLSYVASPQHQLYLNPNLPVIYSHTPQQALSLLKVHNNSLTQITIHDLKQQFSSFLGTRISAAWEEETWIKITGRMVLASTFYTFFKKQIQSSEDIEKSKQEYYKHSIINKNQISNSNNSNFLSINTSITDQTPLSQSSQLSHYTSTENTNSSDNNNNYISNLTPNVNKAKRLTPILYKLKINDLNGNNNNTNDNTNINDNNNTNNKRRITNKSLSLNFSTTELVSDDNELENNNKLTLTNKYSSNKSKDSIACALEDEKFKANKISQHHKNSKSFTPPPNFILIANNDNKSSNYKNKYYKNNQNIKYNQNDNSNINNSNINNINNNNNNNNSNSNNKFTFKSTFNFLLSKSKKSKKKSNKAQNSHSNTKSKSKSLLLPNSLTIKSDFNKYSPSSSENSNMGFFRKWTDVELNKNDNFNDHCQYRLKIKHYHNTNGWLYPVLVTDSYLLIKNTDKHKQNKIFSHNKKLLLIFEKNRQINKYKVQNIQILSVD